MKLRNQLLSAVAGVAALGATQAQALDELTVAYFLEWPMPFEYAKVRWACTRKSWASTSTG
jgi:taurine transport system substrate-binding protein